MITFKHKGNFESTTRFLKRDRKGIIRSILQRYGQAGVTALSRATPVDTGKTAASWAFGGTVTDQFASISWTNSNFNNGVPIALVIQYGHAMPNGGYVEGIDYINPALKPIFNDILEKVWKEVTDK